ncbi:MAG: DUF2279 domain-containing protein [Saprospiraceae bacterium]|nr:DUF2279 domain-containing protein [Saprospiraceae bacterium]
MLTVVVTCYNYSQSHFFKPSDSFNKKRFYLASGFSAVSYSAFASGLYFAWYNKNKQIGFHTFDDKAEWKYMDKIGHSYTSYLQTSLVYNGAQWVGMKDRNSLYWALGLSNLFQTTIEVMDGFSDRWGFSWTDIGANLGGNAFFLSQHFLWKEQKFLLKFSSHKISYSSNDPEIITRVSELYSERLAERLLKDYNGQTYWLSFNPVHLFTKEKTFWPEYLNVAFGYGVDGLLGARANSWTNDEGKEIRIDPSVFPRRNQYYLSLDINLSKIPVKNHFLKSIFSVINIIKIPAPTLELNSMNNLKFHFFYF